MDNKQIKNRLELVEHELLNIYNDVYDLMDEIQDLLRELNEE